MIDFDRIHHKIFVIESNLSKLKVLSKEPMDVFLSDFRYVESAKHLLQVSIECMIDICEHIVAKKRLGTPDSSAECIKLVFTSGYVSKDNMESYITMTKFRNRIVHLYHEVDDEELFSIIQNNLQDFSSFIKEIVIGFCS